MLTLCCSDCGCGVLALSSQTRLSSCYHAVCSTGYVVGCEAPASSTVGGGRRHKEPAVNPDHHFTVVSNQCKLLSEKAIHSWPLVPPKRFRPCTSDQRMAEAKGNSTLFAFDPFSDLVCHAAVPTECLSVNILVWVRSAVLNQPTVVSSRALLHITGRPENQRTELVWGETEAEGSVPKELLAQMDAPSAGRGHNQPKEAPLRYTGHGERVLSTAMRLGRPCPAADVGGAAEAGKQGFGEQYRSYQIQETMKLQPRREPTERIRGYARGKRLAEVAEQNWKQNHQALYWTTAPLFIFPLPAHRQQTQCQPHNI